MIDYFDFGTERLHDTGTRSILTIDGLVGETAPRGDVFDQPENDGAVEPLAQFRSARVPIIEGEVWGATLAAAWSEFAALTAAYGKALSSDVLVKWRPAGTTLDVQGYCRLGGPVMPQLQGGAPVIPYQAQLRFADPRWYTQAEADATTGAPTAQGGIATPLITPIPVGAGGTGGTVTVTTTGRVSTWPRLIVQGPANAPVIGNTTRGEYLYFDGLTLAAGDVLTVETNPRARSAKVAGASVLGALRWATSTFPMLDPGVPTTFQFYAQAGGTTNGSTLTVAWRDAYMTPG